MVQGMGKSSLSRKLIRARESSGLTLAQACALMPNTLYGTLQHLEGRSKKFGKPRPPPDPGTVQIKTVVDVCATYWPAITVSDFVPAAQIKMPWE